jgi:hypothetical protein
VKWLATQGITPRALEAAALRQQRMSHHMEGFFNMREQTDEYVCISRSAGARGALLFFQLGVAVGFLLAFILFASH